MKAYKRNGSWTVNAHSGGIQKRFTGSDKKTVMMQATAWVNDTKSTQSKGSFKASAEQFLRDKGEDLSYATVRGYRNVLKSLENKYPRFCERELISITAQDLDKLASDLEHKEGYSVKTIRNYVGFVGTVFTFKRIRMPIVRIRKERKVELNIPDEFTVKRVLQYAWLRKDHQLWICISLAACGPLRRGEIAALRREDVDFAAGTVHVSHDMVKDSSGVWHLKPPKTETSDRVLKMPQKIMNEIQREGFHVKRVEHGDHLGQDDYVVSMNPDQIYNQFSRMLDKYGIKHFRFHDLRHYCASALHADGYPDKYIEMRTGHAGDEVLRRVYTHVLDDKAQEMQNSMVQKLEELVM